MLDRRLIIVGGKGGVGRTTVAAALGTVLARRGRRVLLAHVRTKQRLAQLLGVAVDETIRIVEPNLWAVNMTPEAALREKGLMVLRFKAVYRAVLENRIVKHFLRAVPALNEYSMLGKVWYHTMELVDGVPRFDTVILDGPAMGHLVTMLRIPLVITETVPEGPLSADAHEVAGLLRDPLRCAMWIVTLAEEMPVRESVELWHKATADLGVRVERLVVNALYPDRPIGPAAELLSRLPSDVAAADLLLAPLFASLTTLLARRRINEHYLRQLEHELPLPRIELPHIFAPALDRAAVAVLAARIDAALLA